ncbi:MAG: hypothetical protein WAW75_03495 [Gallionella sp.]
MTILLILMTLAFYASDDEVAARVIRIEQLVRALASSEDTREIQAKAIANMPICVVAKGKIKQVVRKPKKGRVKK